MTRSPDVTEVSIPADILASLEGVRATQHPNAYRWEPWQDAVIREYWGQYKTTGITQQGVCDVLGSRGKMRPSNNTVQKRYRELTE